jgi:hypothetical protein
MQRDTSLACNGLMDGPNGLHDAQIAKSCGLRRRQMLL